MQNSLIDLDGWVGHILSPDFRRAFLRCFLLIGIFSLAGLLDCVLAQQSVFTGNPAAPLNSGRTIMIIARYVAMIGGALCFMYGLFTLDKGGWVKVGIGIALMTYEGWQALGVLTGRGDAAPLPGLNF